MTGQDLLDRMELLNQELQLQSGEDDVTRGLLALNVAQDYFEALAAARSKLFWGTSSGTVTTAASTETTAWPTGLLRLDGLQLLDSNGNIEKDLDYLERTGGHRPNQTWPIYAVTTGSGKPAKYWSTGSYFYWAPLPDDTYTIRWYGLQSASNITASGTFAYPDIAALPLASFATQLIKIGLDDDAAVLASLAEGSFLSTLQTLELTNRTGPKGMHYTQQHME